METLPPLRPPIPILPNCPACTEARVLPLFARPTPAVTPPPYLACGHCPPPVQLSPGPPLPPLPIRSSIHLSNFPTLQRAYLQIAAGQKICKIDQKMS
eukprot:6969098-Prorocentrum_lima.AAC.1